MFHSISSASVHVSKKVGRVVPGTTIKALEARGVTQRFVRDSTGRRLVTDEDIEVICKHLARQYAPEAA